MKTCRCGSPLEKRWRHSFGRRSLVWQCTTCLRVAGKVTAREIRELDGEAVKDAPSAKVKHQKRPNSQKRAYHAALRSAHWKQLRERVFARAGGICEAEVAPGIRCDRPATDLAHLDYSAPLGQETEAHVQANCRACNQDEKRRRITRAVFGD